MPGQSNVEQHQEQQKLQRQLDDLETVLAQFRDKVRADPAVWHDPKAVGAAWGTVRQISSVEQNLHRLWMQDILRRRARALAPTADVAEGAGRLCTEKGTCTGSLARQDGGRHLHKKGPGCTKIPR